MISRARTLAADGRGSVTVELALVAPVLATLIIGIADISIAFGQKLELEQGAQRAIEKVMQTTGSSTVANTIKQEAVCQVNGSVKRDAGGGEEGDGAEAEEEEEGETCAEGRITADDVAVSYRLECISEGGSRTESTATDAAVFDALTCDPATREARYLSVTVVNDYTPMFPIHWGTGGDGVYTLTATAGVRTQ